VDGRSADAAAADPEAADPEAADPQGADGGAADGGAADGQLPDFVTEVEDAGQIAAWSPAAVAGTPSVTLPIGADGPLPLGLTVLGTRFGDAALLRLAAELEQLVGARVDPGFLPTWSGA